MELFRKMTLESQLHERIKQILGPNQHLAYRDPNSELRVGLLKEGSKFKIIINNQVIALGIGKNWKISHADYNFSEILDVLRKVPTPKPQPLHQKLRASTYNDAQQVNLADETFMRGLSGLL